MRIGVLRVYFHILAANSLKQKRQVMQSLKDRLLSNCQPCSSLENPALEKSWSHGRSTPKVRAIAAP